MEGGASDSAKKDGPNKDNISKREKKGELSGIEEDLKYCCSLAPEMCKTKAEKAADCLNKEMGSGSSVDSSWKTCEVECGEKNYGDLVHIVGGKYDPSTGVATDYDESKVDEMMKECYEGKTFDWAPSPTVLTASEMAPVVPSVAKKYVQKDTTGEE